MEICGEAVKEASCEAYLMREVQIQMQLAHPCNSHCSFSAIPFRFTQCWPSETVGAQLYCGYFSINGINTWPCGQVFCWCDRVT